MRCACTEETIKAGLWKRGLPEDTGIGTRGTKTIASPEVINVSSAWLPEAGFCVPTAAGRLSRGTSTTIRRNRGPALR
jgi:hypothetical protein